MRHTATRSSSPHSRSEPGASRPGTGRHGRCRACRTARMAGPCRAAPRHSVRGPALPGVDDVVRHLAPLTCAPATRQGFTRCAKPRVPSVPPGQAGTPTMVGFNWSSTPSQALTIPGDDGWCVRNAVCRLLGWQRDLEEGRAFIKWPEWTDVIKLAMHLGLTVFEIAAPGVVWDELVPRPLRFAPFSRCRCGCRSAPKPNTPGGATPDLWRELRGPGPARAAPAC